MQGQYTRSGGFHLDFMEKSGIITIQIKKSFGKDVMLIPEGEESVTVTAEVAVSPQFFAWVFGFGTEAEILAPEEVRREAGELAARIAEKYRN